MKKMFFLLLGAILALPLQAQPLLVAAASDLTHCIDELAAAFAKQAPGAKVKVALGSSGHFYAQIRNGAPFDVLLSADMEYPRQLAKLGVAEGATLKPYAIGRIALWSLDPRLDPAASGMAVLRDPRVAKVAIANPAVAPYGRAAKAALERDGLWQAVQPRIVIGENVAQTAQFVQSGNAQLGIVSLAMLNTPKAGGRYYVIPMTGLAPIEQGAIVTRHGAANPLAPRFVLFMDSPAARAILERHGFSLPPHD
ncbi:MAG TPA: molybdate ABC transporter substrate-binding protein [Telluria sp.]